MTTFDERSRVVTWEDPVASWKAASGLGGIEVLRAIEGGALPPPPVARLLGFEVDQVSEGLVTFAFEPAEFHYNPLGTVHGGIVTTVLDSAMGCAVHSRLRAGLSYTTLELKVNFLKPVRVTTGRVRGEGKVVHLDDGGAVTIRSIEPADAYPLLRMFDRLSPESIYHRFFSPMPRPRRAALLHLAGLDHELHEALVAQVDHEIVAVARYDGRPGEDDAEVAVIVDDEWQDRGLGTRLLHHLAGVGSRRGLVAFRATVLGENRRALPFLRRLSPAADVRFRDGEYQIYAPFDGRAAERSRGRSATP